MRDLIKRLVEWERIERGADLPRHPDDKRVADLLAETASRLSTVRDALEVEKLAKLLCRQGHVRQFGDDVWREGELDRKVEQYWTHWVDEAQAIRASAGLSTNPGEEG